MGSFNRVIEQQYEESPYKDEISFEEFKKICTSPFTMVKRVMTSGVLKNIRLQYLGTFEINPHRVKHSKRKLIENYEAGLISEKRYLDRLATLNNYKLEEDES